MDPRPLDNGQLESFYRRMLLIRLAEERIGELVEAKETRCPCHLCIGQEAIAVGVCAALGERDMIWGTHRSHGHFLAKGGCLRELMAEILGRKTGCARGRGGSMHLWDAPRGIYGTVPIVAATIPLAVGAALASKLQGDGRVSVAFFGDGATEEGHFHESINMAALYRLPAILVCENNFYASHLPLADRRPADNLHRIGELYGIPGIRLDGNDIEAVYAAAVEAVARARRGEGPTFLELRTYRWRGHVGPRWDLDVGVKRKDELHLWMPKCPIARVETRLKERGVPEAMLEAVRAEVSADVAAAVEYARRSPLPDEGELLDDVYYTEGEAHGANVDLCPGDPGSTRPVAR